MPAWRLVVRAPRSQRVRVWEADRDPAPTLTTGSVHGVSVAYYWLELCDAAGNPLTPRPPLYPEEFMKKRIRRKSPKSKVVKPPYRVPSMEEIAAVRGTNGLKMVSTFSGCGGSCLGFEMAGYDVLWASEFVEAARDVYRLNHPGTILDGRDIRSVKAEDILAQIGMEPGELDVFEGSPPCASFSTAGSRDKGWGQVKTYSDTKQRADDLFFEYARLLDGLRPKAFVAENVTGLVRGKAFGYFKTILEALQQAGPGYRVHALELDASWLGVPQKRKRIIFVGVRSDLGMNPPAPKPLAYQYTIADAIPWLLGFKSEGHGFFDGADIDASRQPAPTLTTTSDGAAYYKHRVERDEVLQGALLEGTAIGREYPKLSPGKKSDRYFNLIRPDVHAPVPTLTQKAGITSAAGVCHPSEPRKFSIPELKRLCAFPDDFQLVGTYSKQWERLARAVPPVMMRAVAEVLRDEIFAKL